MLNLGMPELILILIIALVVFGPSKLPDIGKALGRSLQEFRKATSTKTKREDSEQTEAGQIEEKK